jgi:hypothetical protein
MVLMLRSVQVHLKFKLMMETLYLTVNLIDQYLSVQSVSCKNLKLVGVTALLPAAKYEETWALRSMTLCTSLTMITLESKS